MSGRRKEGNAMSDLKWNELLCLSLDMGVATRRRYCEAIAAIKMRY